MSLRFGRSRFSTRVSGDIPKHDHSVPRHSHDVYDRTTDDSYTINYAGPNMLVCDKNSGTQNVYLPPLDSVPPGKMYKIYKARNSGTVRVNPVGSDRIDMPQGHGDVGPGLGTAYIDLKRMGEFFQCFKTEGADVHWYTIPQMVWIPESGRVTTPIVSGGSETTNTSIPFSTYAHYGCYRALSQTLIGFVGNGTLDGTNIFNVPEGVASHGAKNRIGYVYRTNLTSGHSLRHSMQAWWELDDDRDATYICNSNKADLWVYPPWALMGA